MTTSETTEIIKYRGVDDTYLKTALRRMKRDKAAVAGTIIILTLLLAAVSAPWLTTYDPVRQNYNELLMPPSLKHPLGTDQYGRDLLTRILYGCRYAIIIGVGVLAIQFLVGVTLGLLAGYYGGFVEMLIMRITDVMLAIPSVVFWG